MRSPVPRVVPRLAFGLPSCTPSLFDQTPGFHPTDPEPIPDFDFDVSLPEAWPD